jgi:hypothetical protein
MSKERKENSLKGPILVLLAAGMGSRYGGLKQMDAMGKGGEALMDYSVYDALRSGFTKVVFIIRHDIEADFRSLVLSRMEGKVNYELAFQDPGSLIPPELAAHAKQLGRTKPWGTAHALLCAEGCIDAPFVVLNADDFYSREAFAVMGKYLAQNVSEGALVPYCLEKTLSPLGTVTRGVCRIRDGYLDTIDELKAIGRTGDLIVNTFEDGARQNLLPDTPVSMNFWGFPLSIFPHLHRYFGEFLAKSGKELKSECYLPLAADWFIREGLLKIRSLEANADWFGVTYKEDRSEVQGKITALTRAGVYPERLWA